MESKSDFYQLFSPFILNESKFTCDFNDLTGNSPILRPLLPSMIKNLCQFMIDPTFSIDQTEGKYSFQHFDNLQSARLHAPNLEIKTMFPYEVFKFMHSTSESVILNCHELGSSIVSKNRMPPQKLTGPTSLMLEPFFCYAFSTDLWGETGKWTRFHARLLQLFNTKSLLIDSRGPGHYQLKQSAQRIEGYGIKGLCQDNTYHLFLSWSYPLAALKELEKIISQEF